MSSETKNMTIGCGVWGPVLSTAIIIARSICGSVPMEEWSVWSWFLMTLPVTIPFVILGVGCVLWLIGCLVDEWNGGKWSGLGRKTR